MMRAIDGLRAGQFAPPAEVIVEKESGADHPARTQAPIMRQNETPRPYDMARALEQDLALAQRLAHQAQFAVFEIAQATMNELARGRGGRAGEIVLLAEQHREAATGRIASDADAVD